MSKHSMRDGASGRFERRPAAPPGSRASDGFSTRKRASKLCLALVSTSPSSAFFWPRCGVRISTLRLRFSREQLLQRLAVFELHRHVDLGRNVLLVQVDLLQQRARRTAARRTPAGLPRRTRAGPRSGRCAGGTDSAPPAEARRSTAKISTSSPLAAAIFCRSSISSTVVSRSRSAGRLLEAHLLGWPPPCGRAVPRARSLCRPSRNSRTSWTAPAYASSVVSPCTHGPRQRWM